MAFSGFEGFCHPEGRDVCGPKDLCISSGLLSCWKLHRSFGVKSSRLRMTTFKNLEEALVYWSQHGVQQIGCALNSF